VTTRVTGKILMLKYDKAAASETDPMWSVSKSITYQTFI